MINHQAHYESCFAIDDICLLLPGFDFGAGLGWRLEMYLFGLSFHAELTTRHGARNVRHKSMIVSSIRHEPEPTKEESLLKFFKKKK
jgi:hypothetical protein